MATTIPETVEVPTDQIIEAIGFLFHLASVVGILNGGHSTTLDSYLDGPGCRLFRAAFGREWGDDEAEWGDDEADGGLEARIQKADRAFTEGWAREVRRGARRVLVELV